MKHLFLTLAFIPSIAFAQTGTPVANFTVSGEIIDQADVPNALFEIEVKKKFREETGVNLEPAIETCCIGKYENTTGREYRHTLHCQKAEQDGHLTEENCL